MGQINNGIFFGPVGVEIIEAPWLGDCQWGIIDNTIVLGKTAYTALLFDLWLEKIERDNHIQRSNIKR